eukprot:361401-Chlamydomonas_euryale.AAC.12
MAEKVRLDRRMRVSKAVDGESRAWDDLARRRGRCHSCSCDSGAICRLGHPPHRCRCAQAARPATARAAPCCACLVADETSCAFQASRTWRAALAALRARRCARVAVISGNCVVTALRSQRSTTLIASTREQEPEQCAFAVETVEPGIQGTCPRAYVRLYGGERERSLTRYGLEFLIAWMLCCGLAEARETGEGRLLQGLSSLWNRSPGEIVCGVHTSSGYQLGCKGARCTDSRRKDGASGMPMVDASWSK